MKWITKSILSTLLLHVQIIHNIHCFSSTSSSSNNPLMEASSPSSSTFSNTNNHNESKEINKKNVGLITFDLDDTLFPIGPVVQDANIAMFESMAKFGYEDATEEGYLLACKDIRKERYQPGCLNPITYSELRKQGIQKELERCRRERTQGTKTLDDTKDQSYDDEYIVKKSFEAWLNERQASAERHLFENTKEMFEQLKSDFPNACIAAVTNGRGNPMYMPSIQEYFDFCVSGEDDDVFPNRKPNKEIFESTLSKASSILAKKNDQFSESESLTSFHYWIHVGDDLANDVGASAACGAKAIWMCVKEEEMGKPNDGKPAVKGKTFFTSTASKEEQIAREKLARDAYASVSAKISSLAELPDAIRSVLD